MNKAIDINMFYKMVFIYNALQDGWTIRKLSDNNIEFRKKKTTLTNFNDEDFLDNFIENNLELPKNLKCL